MRKIKIFSIIPSFSIFLLFHFPNKMDPRAKKYVGANLCVWCATMMPKGGGGRCRPSIFALRKMLQRIHATVICEALKQLSFLLFLI